MSTLSTSSDRPNFVGIGGMKCASTWLAECLRSHPEVLLSTPKEVHYFDTPENYAKGNDWYFSHFRGASGYRAVGEIGATYLTAALSIPAMRKVLGPVKVLATLRHPVERFLSEYKHRIRSGELPKRQFSHLRRETLDVALRRCPVLRLNSLYADRLEQVFEHFTREQTFLALKDDIDHSPREMLQRLFGFLDIDTTFEPPVGHKRVSPGIVPRSVWLEQLRQRLYGVAREHSPQVINWVRRWRLAEFYRHLNAAPGETLKIDSEVHEILSDMFARDIEATARVTGLDLSSWLGRRASRQRAAA